MDYKLILTNKGKAKIAAAIANKTTVKPKYIAFGDGNGAVMTPSVTMTALKKEKYRATLNNVYIHEKEVNWIVCEGYIPKDVGEFWIREVGIFDEANELIAVGNYPETYKPTLTLGVSVELKINVIFEVSDAAVITLLLNPSKIFATQDWVAEEIKKININTGVFAGMLAFSAFRTLPAGWARLDGMSVANCDKTFPDIWTKAVAGELPTCTLAQYTAYLTANDGNCGFFGIDTTAKTLRLPLVKDGNAVTQALTSTEIGKWYRDAIRNITGYFRADDNIADGGFGGAITAAPESPNSGYDTKSGYDSKYIATRVSFDASRVVPTAEENRNKQVRYPLIICLATSFVGDSAAAWNQFLGSLTAKANADLSNVSSNIDFVISTAKYSGTNGGSIGGTWNAEYRTWKSGRMEFLGNVVFGSPTRFLSSYTFHFTIPFLTAPAGATVTPKLYNTGNPAVSASYSDLSDSAIVLNAYGDSSSDLIVGLSVNISGKRS